MADNCASCNNLRQYAPDVVVNGITEKVCESLRMNEGLNGDLEELHTNCEDIKDLVDCLLGQYLESVPAMDNCDWKKALEGALANLITTLEAMGCSDCGQWDEIKAIQDGLAGQYTRLIKGTDYDITWFNGFNSEGTTGDIYVGIIVSGNRAQLRMSSGPAENLRLRNARLIDVDLAHHLPIDESPKSRIYGIKFKGEYAYLNDYTYIPGSVHSTGIWNIRPASLRAAWQATMWEYPDAQGYKVIVGIASYADGYNDQFSVFGDDSIYMNAGNHLIDATLLKE